MELCVKVNVFCLWLQKNNEGWGSIIILRVFCKVGVKSFFLRSFSYCSYSSGDFQSRTREDVVGPKVFDKSLSRLETLQSTPPFFQLYFLKRPILGEICSNSFKMRE